MGPMDRKKYVTTFGFSCNLYYMGVQWFYFIENYIFPQGGTLIFSCISRFGSFFAFKVLNFNIFGGFFSRKLDIFGGIKILWIFFESSQNWTIFMGHFYPF